MIEKKIFSSILNFIYPYYNGLYGRHVDVDLLSLYLFTYGRIVLRENCYGTLHLDHVIVGNYCYVLHYFYLGVTHNYYIFDGFYCYHVTKILPH